MKRKKINPIREVPEGFLDKDEIVVGLNRHSHHSKESKDYYYATSKGRILSFSRKNVRELKQHENDHGYLYISVYTTNGDEVHLSVHRAILSSFDPIDNKNEKEVNHKDGNIHNNCVENLEWCSRQENITHAIENGLFDAFSDDEIRDIMRLVNEGYSDEEIAEMKNSKSTTIKGIRTDDPNYNSSGRLKRLGIPPVLKNIIITDDMAKDIFKLAKEEKNDEEIVEFIKKKYNAIFEPRTIQLVRLGKGKHNEERMQRLGEYPVKNNHTPDSIIQKVIHYALLGWSDIAICNELQIPVKTIQRIRLGLDGFDKRLEKLNLPIVKHNRYDYKKQNTRLE